MTRAGRHPESEIFLDDVTVSRRHAEFERKADGGFEIRDDGSLNGTYVNRERIEEQRLAGGDEVQIGKFKLVYLVGGGRVTDPDRPEYLSIGDVLEPAAPRVPRHHDLEDPIPGEPGPGQPRALAVGLPQVLRARRRAAALGAAPAA